MSRGATLAGYVVILVAAAAVELSARRRGRWAAFAEALGAVRAAPVARVLLQAGWLWLGWHVFVRVDWR